MENKVAHNSDLNIEEMVEKLKKVAKTHRHELSALTSTPPVKNWMEDSAFNTKRDRQVAFLVPFV